MHSRVFQISPAPVAKDDYVGDDIIDYCLSQADSGFTCTGEVTDPEVRRQAVAWLGKIHGLSADPDAGTVTIIDKTAYFGEHHHDFVSRAKRLAGVSAETFSGTSDDLGADLFQMAQDYANTYGIYAVSNEGRMINFDDFVRLIAKRGVTYYIGGIYDYEF